MNRFFNKLSIASTVMASVMTLAVPAAQAQTTDTIQGGVTSVNLADGFVSALGSLGVTPGTVAPSRLFGTYVDFPITSGAIELDNAAGQILHSGGLTLTAGKTEVVLESFIIDTTTSPTPTITGLVVVDGKFLGRVTLFDLALPAGFKTPVEPYYGEVNLQGVGVSLDAAAAGALNSVFGLTGTQKALTAGTTIGTASVNAIVPQNRERGWSF